jgi:hypothetical protein
MSRIGYGYVVHLVQSSLGVIEEWCCCWKGSQSHQNCHLHECQLRQGMWFRAEDIEGE